MKGNFQFVLCLAVIIIRPCFCGQLKRFQSNGRVAGVTETHTVQSLSECAILFENNQNSLAFNFNENDNMCELSDNYPEGFTEEAEGWKVYAKIVDGDWSNWMDWDPCSVTCTNDTWTRSRSRSCNNPFPSNGGAPCPGQSTEHEEYNEGGCYEEKDYFIGADTLTWHSAKLACEAMSARLVIIESQQEIDCLQTMVKDFRHWIGLKCNAGTECTWVDGRSLEEGFKAWAPGEPRGHDCVSIGYYGNKWDDVICSSTKRYICKFI